MADEPSTSGVKEEASDSEEIKYAIIRNIPSPLRSKDLRIFFSSFIESGKFHCFHFRHRPEIKAKKISGPNVETEKIDQSSCSSGNKKSRPETCCCVVSFLSSNRDEFVAKFHGKRWTTENGHPLPLRCFVMKLKVNSSSTEEEKSETIDTSSDPKNQTISSPESDETMGESNHANTAGPSSQIPERELTATSQSSNELQSTHSDLFSLPELNPPSVMPQGNVGTPTKYFMDKIQACTLPPVVIKKLGLNFPKRLKSKKYSSVPFEYFTNGERYAGKHDELKSREEEILERLNPPDADDQSRRPDEDNDECEEWERHEALHDDVTQHDRTKPRLYEEEMEVVWEKGGPGIVWYTDDFFWEQGGGGDMDEKWADDWDVDMEIYYDPTAGDKDARDSMQILKEKGMLSGSVDDSVFQKKKEKKNRKRRNSDTDSADPVDFEKYSKGVGRKVMEAQGWKDGQGLGESRQGKPFSIAYDVEETSQGPRSHRGLGYHGAKLDRFRGGAKDRPKNHLITTVYDDPAKTDPKPRIDRRTEATWTKAGNWQKYDANK